MTQRKIKSALEVSLWFHEIKSMAREILTSQLHIPRKTKMEEDCLAKFEQGELIHQSLLPIRDENDLGSG